MHELRNIILWNKEKHRSICVVLWEKQMRDIIEDVLMNLLLNSTLYTFQTI